MIKKIIVSFLLFSAIATFSQSTTSSPYSIFGIGEMKFKGTVENRSMGGLSILRDSIHLNLQNPASVASLQYTSFTVGATTGQTILSTSKTENLSKRTSVDYLALGLPLGKFGATFGLMPYSAVGYDIANEKTDAEILPLNTADLISSKYIGSGGINIFFVGGAYKITPELNFGLTIESYFGKIETEAILIFKDIQFGTQEINVSNASGIGFTTGLQYQSKFKSKIQLSGGLTFTPESNLNFTNSRAISRVQYPVQTQILDFVSPAVADTTVKLPSKFSIGAGVGQMRKWQVGSEIVLTNSSNFGNRFNDITTATFQNATQFKVGGFYIPKFNSFNHYFDRVVYRAGFNYQNTGLVINNKSIKDQTISLGVGLPLGGFANLNLGFEFGKRGTKLANLVSENYNNVVIGLSINDRWFVKRKYD